MLLVVHSLCLFSSFLTLIFFVVCLLSYWFLLVFLFCSYSIVFHHSRLIHFLWPTIILDTYDSFHTCLHSVYVVLFVLGFFLSFFRLSCFIRMWCVPLHVMMIFRCLIFLSAALCRDFVKAKLSHASCELNVPNQSPRNFLQSAKNNNHNYNNNKKFSELQQKNARNARRKLIYRWRKKRD